MNLSNRYLVLTTVPFGYGKGANSNYLTNLAIGLSANSNVSLLLQRQSEIVNSALEGIDYRTCRINKINNKKVNFLFSTISDILYPPYYLFKNRKKIDLLLTFQVNSVNSLLFLLMSKILRKPIVHIIVDYYNYEVFFSRTRKSVLGLLKYINYSFHIKYLLKYFDSVLVLSKFLENHFQKLGFQKNRICLQPHIVEISKFKDVRDSIPFDGDIVSFGVLGSINKNNGIETLLQAYKKVSNQEKKVKLLLLGCTDEEIYSCKEFVKKNKITGDVEYIGKISYNELNKYLIKCDVFILPRPNSIEAIAGFPTKIGEYCSTARPMILSSYGDIPLYFKHRQNAFLAKPSSIEDFADNMLFVINNTTQAKLIGNNGYKWADETIEISIVTSKINDFFNELLRKY
jgi:glycosyltransferase involved in cell wall biosynthesis